MRCSTRSRTCRARRCRPRSSRARSCAARIDGYNPADLDALTAGGEIVWCGVEPLGERDGRIALYLTDHFARLRRDQPRIGSRFVAREQAIVEHLRRTARRSSPICTSAAGGRLPGETVDALWDLVWKGVITNDTFHALRAFTAAAARRAAAAARIRRAGVPQPPGAPPSAEGRWSLVASRRARRVVADRVVDRHRAAAALALRGRHAGRRRSRRDHRRLQRRLRRAQGARGCRTHPPRLFRRRRRRDAVRAAIGARPAALAARAAGEPEVVALAATDPANPYGTTPALAGRPARPMPPAGRPAPSARS